MKEGNAGTPIMGALSIGLIGGIGIFFMATSGTRVTVEQQKTAASPLSFSF